jgi:hypothetical protein
MTGNIPKFMLALESVLFDLLYLTQRFCLYPPSSNELDGAHLLDSPSVDHMGKRHSNKGAAVATRSDDDHRGALHIHPNRQQHDRINDVF